MFVAVLTAAMGLAILPEAHAVTAEAAEPVTYHVKYSADDGDWLYQSNTSIYDDDADSKEVQYLLGELKDGDVVVVYNDTVCDTPLNLGNVHLSNLTMYSNCQWSMVKVGSVDVFYANKGSNCSITGNITNAYVYLNVLCNFNNNVQNLTQYYDSYDGVDGPNIGCDGKVGQFTSRAYSDESIYYTYYEVTGLYVENGVLQDGCRYSLEPVATSTSSPAASSSSSNSSAASSSSSSGSEYDDVPKTGQNNIYLWLLGTAMACFVGSGLLRKASH